VVVAGRYSGDELVASTATRLPPPAHA
jgi:hypothetical protein